jgi:hypothetical protein
VASKLKKKKKTYRELAMHSIASSCYYCSSFPFVVDNRNGGDMATLVAIVVTSGVVVVDRDASVRDLDNLEGLVVVNGGWRLLSMVVDTLTCQ